MAVRLLFEAGELAQSAGDGHEARRFRRRAADLLIALLANPIASRHRRGELSVPLKQRAPFVSRPFRFGRLP